MPPIPSPFGPRHKQERVRSNASEKVTKEQRDTLARIDFVMSQNNVLSYILLFQQAGAGAPSAQKDGMTFHIQNTNLKTALQALLVSLSQVVKIELSQHPEYVSEYKKILEDLLLDVYGVVGKANDRIIEFRKNAKTI